MVATSYSGPSASSIGGGGCVIRPGIVPKRVRGENYETPDVSEVAEVARDEKRHH